MKYLFPILLTAFLLLVPLKGPTAPTEPDAEQAYEGEVQAILGEETLETLDGTQTVQKLQVKISNGDKKDQVVEVDHGLGSSFSSQVYEEGDKVLMVHYEDPSGAQIFFVAEPVRRPALLALFLVFVGVVLLVTWGKGLSALIAMGFSFLVLLKWMLPLFLTGMNPLVVGISGSALLVPAVFSLSHGWNKKTLIAMAGTFITLVIASILALIVSDLTLLTGFANEESTFLKMNTGNLIDFKGLLLAGILIGMLGVLDDVTISQVSLVEEMRELKKNIGFGELFKRAMNVGRDHIASVINTLVLVYTGASLPLLLLFLDSSRTFGEVVNYEFVAEEIVRTLIGSIGLVLAVPITTLIAAKFYSQKK
ncbi:MAG: YibE/F family protein [Patescibacteria group bacterium]